MLLADKLPNTYQESIKNKQFNTSALTVWVEQRYFYLEPNYGKCLIPTVLKIDRKLNTISEIKSDAFVVPKAAVPFYYSFFLGIIDLNGKKLIMLSESVQTVCTINSRDVFKITKPLFLFYNPEHKKNLSDEQAKILINLVVIFQQGMYFSYAYNLTEPLHHIKKLENTEISYSFNWAQTFQNQLKHCNKMWSLPVIQGFVNKLELYINAQKLKIVLISRRSIRYGGPWQYTTGLVQAGYSANYVETQQIFFVNQFTFSFVQVRGSAPIFWNQKFSYGMPSSTQTQKSVQQNFVAFQRHMGNMLKNRDYENIIFLNLLSKQSNSQKKLIQNYQYLIRKTDKQNCLPILQQQFDIQDPIGIRYYYYDVHSRCPNKNYKNVNWFIVEELRDVLLACGFTAVRFTEEKVYQILNIQKGVIRTNCGTCIDRTNIMQSRIAAQQLVTIIGHLNLKIKSFDQQLDFVDGDDAFAVLYRNLWADNGDNISAQYTGTGSTESYAIRKGKLSYMTTIDHGLTSLVRAFRNIRQQDEQKHKTIQFLLKGFQQRYSSKQPRSARKSKNKSASIQPKQKSGQENDRKQEESRGPGTENQTIVLEQTAHQIL